MDNPNIAAIVLAAGKGTRMESDKPKVLHEISGKPMIELSLEKLESLNLGQIIIVVGFKAEEVQRVIGPKYEYAIQVAPKGTGDAVKTALPKVKAIAENILVVNGDDSGFYKNQTLQDFINFHLQGKYPVSVITTKKPQSERIGRIIRDENQNFKQTLEVWEYEYTGLFSDEVNCGAYLFNTEWLKANIGKIDNQNDKKEYRITEALNIAKDEGLPVGLFELKDPEEWVGINTQEDLSKANEMLKII